MRTAMIDTVVQEIRDLIRAEAIRHCYGCSVDHPSQIHHDVCMMSTPKEWVNNYYDIVVSALDKPKILLKVKSELKKYEHTLVDQMRAKFLISHLNRELDRGLDRSVWKKRVKNGWEINY